MSNKSKPVIIGAQDWNDIGVSMAIKTDGTIWAWGGEYDTNTNLDRYVSEEELKIRKENSFVRELYEEYKVALILASGED